MRHGVKLNVKVIILLFVIGYFALTYALHAEPIGMRWTENEDKNANFDHVLAVINQKTGFLLNKNDFIQIEKRKLATSNYFFYAQSVAGTPVQGASIRIWTQPKSKEAIQVEANVENPAPIQRLAAMPIHERESKRIENTATVNNIVLKAIAQYEDNKPALIVKSSRYWKASQLVQIVRIKARRGYHTFTVSLTSKKILSHKYEEFPQADFGNEFSIRAPVFPIYEEPEYHIGQILPRVPAQLKYLKKSIRKNDSESDPFASLRSQHYYYNMFDPILGLTEDGRAQGYWAMSYIKGEAAKIRASFPLTQNSFHNGGAILEGRYATVSLHPAVAEHFPHTNFKPKASLQFMPTYGEEEMIPSASLLGKPLLSPAEAYNRPARRLADHDPASYINDGFDELQVYYSINTLMESLQSMGFTDPELSQRPFNAFLYDPDISMRDNAYYTDDTINFTTYSANAQNYARDNSTIWHELGHGIMDRLMGDSIVLADTGGLSEGMADFVASLVIADKLEGQTYPGMNDYRIINNTGFHLTNEVHDDGEAYGGTMDDLKRAAIAAQGREGLKKVADLTMETMRLTRNNPGLTASGWFDHMLFADARGSKIRAKGELHDFIVSAYSGRNFSLDETTKLADFSLKNGEQEVVAGSLGSRQSPLPVVFADGSNNATYKVNVSLSDGDVYKFKYPVQIKVFFRSGPLQGAIHWDNEENEPKTLTIQGPNESIPVDLTVSNKCDEVNREDGSCVDYAYIQIWNNDATAKKPVAKKRFYLKVKPN